VWYSIFGPVRLFNWDNVGHGRSPVVFLRLTSLLVLSQHFLYYVFVKNPHTSITERYRFSKMPWKRRMVLDKILQAKRDFVLQRSKLGVCLCVMCWSSSIELLIYQPMWVGMCPQRTLAQLTLQDVITKIVPIS